MINMQMHGVDCYNTYTTPGLDGIQGDLSKDQQWKAILGMQESEYGETILQPAQQEFAVMPND